MRRFSLRRFSLRSLRCGAFTAEPSLQTLTADLQRGTFTANSHCGSPARKLSFSASIRWHAGLYVLSFGTVISPDLKKAKNPRQQAAHSMQISGSGGADSHTPFIFLRMSGDMGSLSRFSVPFSASTRFTPCNVYSAVSADLGEMGHPPLPLCAGNEWLINTPLLCVISN